MLVNFIFGIMDSDKDTRERGKCYLLNMGTVDATNASTMAAFLIDFMSLLYPDGMSYVEIEINVQSMCYNCLSFLLGIQYEKVLIVLTDAAAYMLAAMGSLRTLFLKMIHLTCFAHGLHRKAEFIPLKFTKINHTISKPKVFVKVIFSFARKLMEIFNIHCKIHLFRHLHVERCFKKCAHF